MNGVRAGDELGRVAALSLLLLIVVAPLLTLAGGVGQHTPMMPPTAKRQAVDPELGVPLGAPLTSMFTDVGPATDGIVEPLWDRAPTLEVPLHYGLHGSEPAGAMEMRSLHDGRYVYFLARWPSEMQGGEPEVWRNLLTVHWRLVDPGSVSGRTTGSHGLACTVACHTATVDRQGHLVGLRNETIPPGLEEDLPSGGGWAKEEWAIEWSRPRVSASPYDQHMTDSRQGYRFFVKLFLGLEGRADPVSDVHELRLDW